jgi:lysophospholipase L1-like esterase
VRRWLVPITLSLLLTIGTLAVVETVARNTVQVDLKHPSDSLTELFVPDDDTFWGLRPNYWADSPHLKVRWGNEPIAINSLGMRGTEIKVEKPAGVRRVVVLGGSHPMGMWVKSREAYAAVLERLLNARQPGKWEVLNYAVAGYTSWQGVLQMRTKVPRLSPDIIISDLGVNDSLERVPWGLSRSDHQVRKAPIPVAALLSTLRRESVAYRWALQRITEKANTDLSVRVSRRDHVDHAKQIAALANEEGAKTLFMNHFMANVTSPGVMNNHGPKCLYPEDELDPVVDVCGLFADRTDLGKLFADPVHANAAGHTMIANAVLDKLLALGWVE